MSHRIIHADCVEAMRQMPDASVDAIVCDPPYELGFMGKRWDATGIAYSVPLWKEALRVLKPGGHLVAFGGTRTYHRMACAIEDAGFEIRDSLHWFYGSGFPKSLDVSKAIDKAKGATRGVVGWDEEYARRNVNGKYGISISGDDNTQIRAATKPLTAPATPEAAAWEGWGTALKPGHEPVVLARKPLDGTVAANVLAHGTGALNIEACRVGFMSEGDQESAKPDGRATSKVTALSQPDVGREIERKPFAVKENASGRWPPNVLLTHSEGCVCVGTRRIGSGERRKAGPGVQPFKVEEGWNQHSMTRDGATAPESYGTETVPLYDCAPGCPVAELDRQSGELSSGRVAPGGFMGEQAESVALGRKRAQIREETVVGDTGGASRFFPTFTPNVDVPFRYVAKPARGERDAGLHGLPAKTGGEATDRKDGSAGLESPRAGAGRKGGSRNTHPTVKSVELMEWLVTLVTPKGGTVLDPFLGSGSTGCAAVRLGFDFIGIEREAEYVTLAEKRIALALGAPKAKAIADLDRGKDADPRQLSLLGEG